MSDTDQTQPKKNELAPAPAREPVEVNQFAQQAEEAQMGIVREFWEFLKYEKKWWLIPIIVILVLLGVVAFLGSSSPLAPFIYPLF